ncbi:alpha/beta hydrolase family protein [Fibrella forsythiae]|uniref:Acetylxylan esterase n=1 Tax=Fibrella forsythiae TaxID=2817061 RepID=A0ABS3JSU6_9BACT|nr:acetylxylan esterase [Fibrella forsythiae]MBO0952513.1 acetylxylan esterase [Fibrella forsythiae]
MHRNHRLLMASLLAVGIHLTTLAQSTRLPLQLFAYDRAAALSYTDSLIGTQQGIRIHQLSYDSPAGGRVTGMLLVPPGKGPFAGLLLQPGMPGKALAQLPRALYLARHGAVVLSINAPFTLRSGNPIQLTPADSIEQVHYVINLQRAVDVLRALPEVDSTRLGYVGRSHGGAIGGLLAGIERRLKTYILVVADGGLVAHYSSGNGEPGDQLPITGQQRARWLAAMQPIEPIRYVGRSAPASLLLQSAYQDEAVPVASAREFQRAAPASATVKWYQATHQLNAQAYVDQLTWLHATVGTTPPGPEDQPGPDFSVQLTTPPASSSAISNLEVTAQALATYVGTYEIAPGQQLSVSFANGKLAITPPGETTKVDLKPVREAEFEVVGQPAHLVFRKDAAGKVLAVEVRFGNGGSATAKKL